MKATLRHGVQALLVLLAVLAPLSVQAERKLLDQVVAIVDEDVILQTELEARISTITSRLSAQGTALPPRQAVSWWHNVTWRFVWRKRNSEPPASIWVCFVQPRWSP